MSRNYGFGRSLAYAGRQVLRRRFGNGHYASQSTQEDRWGHFAAWLKASDIRDMRDVVPAHVHAWADERLESGYAQRTVRDEISAVNVVLRYASRNCWRPISPSAIVGRCDHVRREAPATHDLTVDANARIAIAGSTRAAVVYLMARSAGLRSREASLADYPRLARESNHYGRVNIVDGTKGGRVAPRWIAVTPELQQIIATALSICPEGSRNLLRPDERYVQWRNRELRTGREALHSANVRGYHDARAAWACDRYRELTGHNAPAITGRRQASRTNDHAARTVIATELGHGRIDICTSYVGAVK